MRLFLVILMYCAIANIQAQKTWTLEECIQCAQEHSLSLQLGDLGVENYKIESKRLNQNRLPDLTANLSGGNSFGRNIDPVSNDFVTKDILFANGGLSTSVLLFKGGMLNHSIKKNKLDLKAAELDYNQAVNDLSLRIAGLYLNVIFSQERLQNVEEALKLSNASMGQIQKLINAGLRPDSDILDMEAQVVRNEGFLVAAQNQVNLALLQLKQAMQLDPNAELTIQTYKDIDLKIDPNERFQFKSIFEHAVQAQFKIKSSQIKVESAKRAEQIAKTAYYPSFVANANLGSRYSDASIFPTRIDTVRQMIPGFYINGTELNIEQDVPRIAEVKTTPFLDQLDNFFGYGYSVGVNIPIYSNYNTKASVKRAQLATQRAEIELQQTKEILSNDIMQAIANYESAYKEFQAAEKSEKAMRSVLDKTNKKLEIGSSTTFEQNQSQVNWQTAINNLTIARYDLVFKRKIVDYYLGRPITL